MSIERDVQLRKLETDIVAVINDYSPLEGRGPHYMCRCPFHDDRTPSMSVHANRGGSQAGWYHCFGCGAGGDVYNFLQRFHGIGFLEAMELLGGHGPVVTRDLLPPSPYTADKQEWVNRMWDSRTDLTPCSPAGVYLSSRGIPVGELGPLPDLAETKLGYRGDGAKHPVLLAAIRDGNDNLVGLQRTYLTRYGKKLAVDAPKLSVGRVRGGAIKIGNTQEELIVCEGLEDALSIWHARPGPSVWAAAGGNMLPSLPIPVACRRLIIARDNDEVGRKVAEATAAAFRRSGRQILVMSPSPVFKDFNEELMASAMV